MGSKLGGLWNVGTTGDTIPAPALNLTKLVNYLALLIGGITTYQAANADEKTTGGEQEAVDSFNFNDDQRLVIIIALIAAVAIVNAADLLARAIATSRVASAPTQVLTTTLKAKKTDDSKDSGRVTAIRTSDGAMLFFSNDKPDAPGEWLTTDQVTLG